MIKFAAMIIVAAVTALYTTNYVLSGQVTMLTKHIGSWQTWRNAGTVPTDPYTRSYFIDKERLPVSRFETVEFRAIEDDTGRRLSPSCIYRLSGVVPSARRWSLVASPISDTEDDLSSKRQILSEHVLLTEDDRLEVMLSPEVYPGNWIETEKGIDYELVMQIYNPVYSAGRSEYTAPVLEIKRVKCL